MCDYIITHLHRIFMLRTRGLFVWHYVHLSHADVMLKQNFSLYICCDVILMGGIHSNVALMQLWEETEWWRSAVESWRWRIGRLSSPHCILRCWTASWLKIGEAWLQSCTVSVSHKVTVCYWCWRVDMKGAMPFPLRLQWMMSKGYGQTTSRDQWFDTVWFMTGRTAGPQKRFAIYYAFAGRQCLMTLLDSGGQRLV